MGSWIAMDVFIPQLTGPPYPCPATDRGIHVLSRPGTCVTGLTDGYNARRATLTIAVESSASRTSTPRAGKLTVCGGRGSVVDASG